LRSAADNVAFVDSLELLNIYERQFGIYFLLLVKDTLMNFERLKKKAYSTS